ncbi:unnamed protein product [Symbiodinium natans]|uniref:Uncharacterized protein n=1 Tax=Symbiodinium natans TaxID=878477 RepID=A0A812V8X8_9DINO|nr:unnamed protein product [Symbiodinium natans]
MEVVLKDTKGVSPETIISIRAGSTRRQVPVSLADKPFKFPCQLAECGAIKVDLMTVTASARAILRPEGEQDVQMKMTKKSSVEAQPAAEAEVSFLVRSSSGEPSTMSHDERAAKKRGLASATEEYLGKHGVLTFIQGVLQGVIRDRPEDPYKYVADQFASASVSKKAAPTLEEMRQTARDALLHGATSGKLLEVLRHGTTPKANSPTSGELPKADVAEQSASVDELRQAARDALLKGAQSGKLFDALAQTSAEKAEAHATAAKDVDQLRQQARNLLLEGAQSGKLLEVLQGAPPPEPTEPADVDKLRKQAREALLAGAQSGKLFDVLAETAGVRQEEGKTADGTEEIDALRQQARDLLLEGAQSGKLLEVLQGASPEQGKADGTDEIDALRQQARDLLLEGAQSGKLLEVLQGASPAEPTEPADDVDKLRQQAREALLAGAQSGKLFDVLAQTPKPSASQDGEEHIQQEHGAAGETDEIDALRQQTRDLLLEGAQSGKLLEVLQAASPPEPTDSADDEDKLRRQAREALLAGAESGKLFEALTEKKPPADDDMDDLRRQAREALLLGAQSGKLMQLLAKNSEQKAAKRSAEGPDDLELLRQQAREALILGAQSGRLLEVLAKPDETDEVFQLKRKLCEAMAGSMETGVLTEALKDVRDLRTQEICQEASNALRDGAESGKVLLMLADKAAGTGESEKTLETTQKPEEVTQKLAETAEALKASPEVDRAKAADMALQLKLLQDQKRTMAAEKECLEDLLKELELKNSVLRVRSRSTSKEEAS